MGTASGGVEPVVVGLVASDGLARELAEELAEELPDALGERFDGVRWRAELSEEALPEQPATSGAQIEAARRRLRSEGWELGVGLTDLPLRTGHRPVTAHASATHGVGLVSVPALGARSLERRVTRAVLHVIEGLLGESVGRGEAADGGREGRMGARLGELRSPLGAKQKDQGTVRFAGAVVRGNLRLLIGMVRANSPSTVIVRLSRALAGALGTGAISMASSSVWVMADKMTWPRLIALSFATVLSTVAAIVVAHGLWERSESDDEREQVALFNLVTTLTLLLGVATLYLALLLGLLAAGAALIPPDAFKSQIGHGVDAVQYVKLAWLGASLATIGGALGSVVESDLAVREAAYRNRADERTETSDLE